MSSEIKNIAFVWQGSSDKHTFNHWNDGLRCAMRILERSYNVTYHEPWDNLGNPDFILYWEAPCTANGKNAEHYNRIRMADCYKALLFAGGPIQIENCLGFDLFFTESELNDKEFEQLNLPYRRAFGVNTDVFKPMRLDIEYDAMLNATFADWKRHRLFAEAMGSKGAVCGRKQDHDLDGYNACVQHGVNIYPELSYDSVAKLMNESKCVLNTASYWGGGQRTTLEAMACNRPVIVMNDSPKNIEYVHESTAGIVCEPNPEAIREAIKRVDDIPRKGREYVMSKWTPQHYADSLIAGIEEVIKR